MADYGTDGAAGQVGQGPVNWGDNVAGMGSQSSAPSEMPAVDENAYPQQDDQQPQQQQQQPTDQQADQSQAPSFWEPGQPLPWRVAPMRRPCPTCPSTRRWTRSNCCRRSVQAREQAIVAHFQALLGQASEPGQQQEIDREYRITLREYRAAIREQQAELKDWQRQHRERQMMVNMVPALRDQHAEFLSKKHNVPKESVLYDHFTKQPIWNHQAMERQAQFLGQMGYQSRVQARGDRDAGIATTGAASPAPGDVTRMSDSQFAQYRDQVRKSGGRLLNRVG